MPNDILTAALEKVASRANLTAAEAGEVLGEVMEGRASEVQTAAFLVALRTKGETTDEIIGFARTMRALAEPVEVRGDDLVDTAGTGGGRTTFNVSTTAAFVAAGAGCTVAKHGNRSATSKSGSADVLEALGARIDLEPGAVAECIETVGFGFMFAPLHHRAMRHVVPVRKELGVRTAFNFLGPLTNPAGATRQLIGVSDPAYMETIAAALDSLGGRSALVVSSEDGLDEVSASAATRVVELKDGSTRSFSVTPEQLGVDRIDPDANAGGTPDQNAEVTRSVLAGADGPARALTLVNAGAAVYVADRAQTLEAGVRAAAEAIDSGAAREALERYVELTGKLAAS